MIETLTEREAFAAKLAHHPAIPGDAIVVLCGDEWESRTEMAGKLFGSGWGKTIVLTGGVDAAPRTGDAHRCFQKLLAMGVAHDRIIQEHDAQHTRDQAVYVAAIATEKQWRRVLLVASWWHMDRAFLTCLKALQETGADEQVRLVPVAITGESSRAPEGMVSTRSDLHRAEVEDKIERYRELGHVASYEDGIAYLTKWEAR